VPTLRLAGFETANPVRVFAFVVSSLESDTLDTLHLVARWKVDS
jgi:hypothetical protein